ncbi:MAG: hypothetical protein ACOYLK_09735 [Sphingomonas sp.]
MTNYRENAENAVRNYVFLIVPDIFHANWPDQKPKNFHTSKAVWRSIAKQHILEPFCIDIGFEVKISDQSWNVLYAETLNTLIEYIAQKASKTASEAAIKTISFKLN